MNRNRMEGNWHQFKGSVNRQRAPIAEDPLASRIHETCGTLDDEAERESTDWQQRLSEIIRTAE